MNRPQGQKVWMTYFKQFPKVDIMNWTQRGNGSQTKSSLTMGEIFEREETCRLRVRKVKMDSSVDSCTRTGCTPLCSDNSVLAVRQVSIVGDLRVSFLMIKGSKETGKAVGYPFAKRRGGWNKYIGFSPVHAKNCRREGIELKQQKKKKAQVLVEAQHLHNEDSGLERASANETSRHDPIIVEDLYDELLEESRGTWMMRTTMTVWKKEESQMARKGLHTYINKDDSEGSDEDSKQDDSVTGTKIPINPVPVAMKIPSIATYKIIKQREKGAYQIVREDGTDIVYINFGAMLKDITRDDLIELYRIVMNRYGIDGLEDKLEKIFWKYLKDMFEEPLSTDPVWSVLSQQRIISWRYYATSFRWKVDDEDCYKLLKMDGKAQAVLGSSEFVSRMSGWRIRRITTWWRVDMVINPPWNLPFLGAKGLTSPEQTATGKGISNPLMAVMVCQKPYGIQLTNVSCTES
ncbi:hypothetical protein Tco_0276767 [Tanacetum coccineum]